MGSSKGRPAKAESSKLNRGTRRADGKARSRAREDAREAEPHAVPSTRCERGGEVRWRAYLLVELRRAAASGCVVVERHCPVGRLLSFDLICAKKEYRTF